MQITIIKITGTYDHYGDYNDSVMTHGVKNWMEVGNTEYRRIVDAVDLANRHVKGDYHYIVIETSSDNFMTEIAENARAFVKIIDEQKDKADAKKAVAKEKLAATALARKQKQFEKLKKELGDNN